MSSGTSSLMSWPQLPSRAPESLRERDEYAWLEQQAALLRSVRHDEIDRASLAQYLDDMMASYRDDVESHLRVLLLHMLKVRHQPAKISGSWRSSIVVQQADAAKKIKRSLGMKPHLADMYADAYRVARLQAAAETGIDEKVFPPESPWTLDEALSYVPPPKAPHPSQPSRPKKPRQR